MMELNLPIPAARFKRRPKEDSSKALIGQDPEPWIDAGFEPLGGRRSGAVGARNQSL